MLMHQFCGTEADASRATVHGKVGEPLVLRYRHLTDASLVCGMVGIC